MNKLVLWMAVVILIVSTPVYGNDTSDNAIATLVIYSGECLVIPADTVSGTLTDQNIELKISDRVETCADSNIEIRYPDSTYFRLSDNSIIEMDIDGFFLKKGGAWIKVEKNDREFEVKTDDLVAGVRGTEFTVETDESSGKKNFRVNVIRGSVGVSDFHQREWLALSMGQEIESRGRRSLYLFKKRPFNIEKMKSKWRNFWKKPWNEKIRTGSRRVMKIVRRGIVRTAKYNDRIYKKDVKRKYFLNPYRRRVEKRKRKINRNIDRKFKRMKDRNNTDDPGMLNKPYRPYQKERIEIYRRKRKIRSGEVNR